MRRLRKIINLKKARILLFLGFLISVFFPRLIRAEGASLYLFPQRGSFTASNTFEVSIFMNTGNNNVNAVKVELKFDPAKIRVITPTKGISIIGEWTFPPGFSNTQGTVTLQGGFPYEGINTSEGLISTVVFEAVNSGETEIYFSDSCKILVGEKSGQNILSSINRGLYEILPPPFKGPAIFSETHLDQNQWYKNNNPSFSWEKIEGAEGYSYTFNDDPNGEPDNIIDTQFTSVSFQDVGEGSQYFHLKGKKGQAWGGTSHFKVMIDKQSPDPFKPYLEFLNFTPDNNLLIYFNSQDYLSGLDYSEARITDMTDSENPSFSGWLRTENPFSFSVNKSGFYELTFRIFDKAGNFQEGNIQIRVVNPFFILTDNGVQIQRIFFSWWQIYALMAVILIEAAILIFVLLRRKREGIKGRLGREIREAEKEIEDVKKAEKEISQLRAMEQEAGQEWKRLKEKLEEGTDKANDDKNVKDNQL